MKYIYFSILAFLCFPLFTKAQSNFKPGYVIKLNGDTVKGSIDYREWGNSPLVITFKSATNNTIRYSPADIKAFNILGFEEYVKYTGLISTNAIDENHIQNGRDTSVKNVECFLQTFQKGKHINLYAYTDNVKTRFFFNTPDDIVMKELLYRIFYKTSVLLNDRDRTTNENIYAQQLSGVALRAGVFDDKLQRLIDDATYNKLWMIRVVSAINGVEKQSAESGKTPFELYVGIGANITAFKPGGTFVTAGGKNYTSVFPRIAFGFNAYSNPNTKRLLFSIDVALSKNQYRSLFNNAIPSYAGATYKFDQIEFSLVPQITYNVYNADNFKYFITGGFNISHFSYTNKAFEKDGAPVQTALNLFALQEWGNVYMVKTGVLVSGNIQVFGSYVGSTDVSLDKFFSIRQNTMQLGINYFLGSKK